MAETDSSDSRDIRMITFRIGTETYLLDIMALRQILPYAGSTAIPHAPEFVEGIIILRNEAIPIIDLRERLYEDIKPLEHEPLVLVTQIDQQTVGLKVDEVRQIVNVRVDSIIQPPEMLSTGQREIVVGVVEHESEVLLLLDLETLLTRSEKQSLRESMTDIRAEASTRSIS